MQSGCDLFLWQLLWTLLRSFPPRARLYSFGNTLTNLLRPAAHASSKLRARVLPVYLKWRSIRRFKITSSLLRFVCPWTTCASRRMLALGFLFLRTQHRFQRHHRQIAFARKVAVRVIHIGNAARHAGGKIAPGFTQHHYRAAGHVFATMVPSAFDNGRGA